MGGFFIPSSARVASRAWSTVCCPAAMKSRFDLDAAFLERADEAGEPTLSGEDREGVAEISDAGVARVGEGDGATATALEFLDVDSTLPPSPAMQSYPMPGWHNALRCVTRSSPSPGHLRHQSSSDASIEMLSARLSGEWNSSQSRASTKVRSGDSGRGGVRWTVPADPSRSTVGFRIGQSSGYLA